MDVLAQLVNNAMFLTTRVMRNMVYQSYGEVSIAQLEQLVPSV